MLSFLSIADLSTSPLVPAGAVCAQNASLFHVSVCFTDEMDILSTECFSSERTE